MRALVVVLVIVAVVVAAVRALDGVVSVWAAGQRERSELVRAGGSWQPLAQPGIRYQVAERVVVAGVDR